ncbi:MAG: o-succinylbenzoate synthase [Clostridia bacterium]|nr:o-succinylbenzoate synthase [Clostridia bacterium]
MRLERVRLHVLRMRMKEPFRTSFGVEEEKRVILVEADVEGAVGVAECVAMVEPLYNEEWVEGAFLMLRDFLAPALLGADFDHPREVAPKLDFIRGNRMAKSAIESAIWDAYAKARGIPLWEALGGSWRPIPVGISVGIQPSPEALVRKVEGYLAAGYRRVKLKIAPGADLEYVAAVRRAFPDVPVMVDANSAYRLADADHLARLDDYDLMMIEQPLGHDDIVWHARLQSRLRTPICLDESIHTPEDAEKAIAIGACRVVNVKIGRVGGLERSLELHDVCRAAGVPVWCGGMLETGIGRAHNVAITTLPGFTLPGDTAASSRYWDEDIIEPPVVVTPEGTILPPKGPGIGYEVRWDRIARVREAEAELVPS